MKLVVKWKFFFLVCWSLLITYINTQNVIFIYIYIDLWACTEGELALFKSYAIKQFIGCLTSISLAKLLFCILTDISAVSPCSSYSDSSQFKNIYILHVYVYVTFLDFRMSLGTVRCLQQPALLVYLVTLLLPSVVSSSALK